MSTNSTWKSGSLGDTDGWDGFSPTVYTRGNEFVAIGDSITGSNTDRNNNAHGNNWFPSACIRSNGVMKYIFNAGVSGERSDQMLARIQTDVVSRKPKYCSILAGTNDIGQDIPLTTIMANIESMMTILLANHITPILCTIPPRDNDTATRRLNLDLLNTYVRELAFKNGLHLLDFYSVLVDPSNGNYKSGYTGDNIHPGITAVKAMSQYVVDTLVPKLNVCDVPLPKWNDSPINIINKGLFVVDTNADGIADGWDAPYGSGTFTKALVTDSAIHGKWQEIVKTDAAATSVSFGQSFPKSSGWALGDKIAFLGRVDATLEAGNADLTISLQFETANKTIKPMSQWKGDIKGVFYLEGVIPSGTTKTVPTVTIANGTGTVRIAQMGVINLSRVIS